MPEAVLETELGQWKAELEPLEAAMWKNDDYLRARSGATGLFLFDQPPGWDDLLYRFERASRIFVRLRQRIVSAPLAVGYPRWVLDRNFDLSLHVRRIRLPEPGSEQQLLDFIAADVSNAFDRSRSPWSAVLVEGMEGGRAALVMRTHHVMLDGGAAAQLFATMFDFERDAPSRPSTPPAPEEPDVTETGLLREGIAPGAVAGRAARLVGGGARGVSRVLRNPAATIGTVSELTRGITALRAASGGEANSLLTGRSASSRLAVFDVPLQDFRAGVKAVGGSVNDGFLAAVSGGIGRYSEKMGVPVESVAVSFASDVRRPGDPPGGNRFSGAVVSAPVADGDVAKRIGLLREQVLAARSNPLMSLVWSVAPIVYRLPGWLVANVGGGGSPAQVQTSNLMGSPVPVYLAGAQLEANYGFGPHPGTAMMIVLQSYAGRMCVGVNADAAAVVDLALMTQCLREAFDEIIALAPEHGAGEDGS